MINFRFHIASLIAIFLALALGVVMGSTVIDRAIVDGLRDQIDRVEAKANDARADNKALQEQLDDLNLYSAQSAEYAVRNELSDQAVAIVAERGLDEEAVTAQSEMLRSAGATVVGILWLEKAWNLTDEGRSADALRDALGSTTDTDRALREEGIAALSRRLTRGAATAGENDVVDSLAKAGFVTLEGVGDRDVSAASFPGTGSRALLLGGPESDIVARTTMADLSRALVASDTLTAVGEVDPEGFTNRGLWLAPIRNDDDLSAKVSTVDNVDLIEGRVASALAIAALSRGVVGSYGFGAGADSTVPPLVPATR
jgi:hypothetical protein